MNKTETECKTCPEWVKWCAHFPYSINMSNDFVCELNILTLHKVYGKGIWAVCISNGEIRETIKGHILCYHPHEYRDEEKAEKAFIEYRDKLLNHEIS